MSRQQHGKGGNLKCGSKNLVSAEHAGMGSRVNPLAIIYWTRLGLGIVAALVSALLGSLIPDFSFLNGVTIALLIYVITYYVYKPMFLAKVEKPSKLFTTGVGAYFLSWLVMWALFHTLLRS